MKSNEYITCYQCVNFHQVCELPSESLWCFFSFSSLLALSIFARHPHGRRGTTTTYPSSSTSYPTSTKGFHCATTAPDTDTRQILCHTHVIIICGARPELELEAAVILFKLPDTHLQALDFTLFLLTLLLSHLLVNAQS